MAGAAHREPPRAALPRASALLPLALAVLVLFVGLAEWRPLVQLRHAVFDHYQRLHPRAESDDPPVVVVDLDDESLRRVGQWPWPRPQVAALTSALQAAGAAAIVFDVVFAEPDRTSPRAALSLWQPAPALAQRLAPALAALPDHDTLLADTLRRGRVVLGLALNSTPVPGAPPLQAPKAMVIARGDAPPDALLHALPRHEDAVGPLPALAAAAAGVGVLSFVPDDDGVVRRVPLVARYRDQVHPSLMAEALRVGLGARRLEVDLHGGSRPALRGVRIGDVALPTTPTGELWVHYAAPAPSTRLPAWAVLEGRIDRARLDGRIVLVGTSAQGLLDLRFSPQGGVIPGVDIHAQALEQALGEHPLQRPRWAAAAETGTAAAAALAAGGTALATGAAASALAALALVALLALLGWGAFVGPGWLLDPSLAVLAALAGAGLCSVLRHQHAERRQRWMRDAFSRYVSPNLVRHLAERPEALVLGGRRQQCTFVFTDLAGFTGQMERLDPAQAVNLLNHYLDRMVAIAFEHDGTLDRIVGDAVVVMFSAPVEQADHRERALRCALAMRRFADGYAAELTAQGQPFGRTRIGVHSGEVIVGNFGGRTMFDYRALGDPVNTAARIEGANKHLGTWICVSDATLAGCPGVLARPIGPVLLYGKRQPLLLHEPLDGPPDLDYLAAWTLLREGRRQEALRAFSALAAARPDDPLPALQRDRLAAGREAEPIRLGDK
ncbi:CHASE2 domain-containing protein [Aquabacterium sp. J223]|uniref:CHASE2 domain-containing protein n=1 Tax=Aquabacterium sp. J223 TaxID=2898431 RepID=UPI0021ADFAAC|nr:adenylate/guanylate cyclase domain-containing protein [Aquabacterium sp. J223]UUX97898.1 adenylate/guanylate cyclase domain-containing protein [Aquabacterium sp. J223]